MRKLIIALGAATLVSGCALFNGGNNLTEQECRALQNFWEFNFAVYEDTRSGMSTEALNKFTWNNGYCEFVQENHDLDGGGDDGNGDEGDDGDAGDAGDAGGSSGGEGSGSGGSGGNY